MERNTHNTKRSLLGLCLCALALLAGCQRYPYRARILDSGVLPPPPGTPVYPTPAPTLAPVPGTTLPPATSVTPALPPATVPPATLPGTTGIVLRKTGPTQATVGALVTYRIEVTNSGAAARGVAVSDQIMPGLSYASSVPPATSSEGQLQWQLGDLPAGATRTIDVSFRAERSGIYNNCAVARTADGQTSQDCASTTVLVPELEVRMSVVAAQPIVVGQEVTFQITVTNRSNLPAGGLLITDRFDPGLDHAVAESPIEKDLELLPPGQSRTIGVTFRVTRAGELCNSVDLSGEGGIRGSARACINAVPPDAARPPQQPVPQQPPAQSPEPPRQPPAGQRPSVSVKMSGPTTQDVEKVAEFFVDITNDGDTPLTNLTITDSYDPSLYPVQATDGYRWEGEKLIWTFPNLAVGKTLRLQLNCKCLSTAEKACNRVTVFSKEGAQGEAEACLAIRRNVSQLEVEINDLADPVAMEKQFTYVIDVTNKGQTADQRISVLVILPPEMSLVRLGTSGPSRDYGVDGQNVRFAPLAELKAGETATYRVRVSPKQQGQFRVEVVLKSDGMPEPVTVEEMTTVTRP